jgi:hypothetical protein
VTVTAAAAVLVPIQDPFCQRMQADVWAQVVLGGQTVAASIVTRVFTMQPRWLGVSLSSGTLASILRTVTCHSVAMQTCAGHMVMWLLEGPCVTDLAYRTIMLRHAGAQHTLVTQCPGDRLHPPYSHSRNTAVHTFAIIIIQCLLAIHVAVTATNVQMQYTVHQLDISPLPQGVQVHPAVATQVAQSQTHLMPCPGTAAVVQLH